MHLTLKKRILFGCFDTYSPVWIITFQILNIFKGYKSMIYMYIHVVLNDFLIKLSMCWYSNFSVNDFLKKNIRFVDISIFQYLIHPFSGHFTRFLYPSSLKVVSDCLWALDGGGRRESVSLIYIFLLVTT